MRARRPATPSKATCRSSGPDRSSRTDEYTVLFTNPLCRAYDYPEDQVVLSNAGERLTHKPENVFCGPADGVAVGRSRHVPAEELFDWIRDPETTEIFFAYLSFSNTVAGAQICRAIQERNVKVTLVLDRETGLDAAEPGPRVQAGNGDACSLRASSFAATTRRSATRTTRSS